MTLKAGGAYDLERKLEDLSEVGLEAVLQAPPEQGVRPRCGVCIAAGPIEDLQPSRRPKRTAAQDAMHDHCAVGTAAAV